MTKQAEAVDGMVTVTINGQEYIVPEAMAQALQAEQASNQKKLQSQKEQSQQEKETLLSRINNMTVTPPKEPEMDDEFWVQPEKYIQNAINKAVKVTQEQMRTEYQQDVTEKQFWADFYSKNPDLKEHKFIVEAVVARDNAELAKMTVEDAAEAIEERVKKEILKFSPKQTKTEEVVVESPSISVDFDRPAPDTEKDQKSGSLSEIIKNKNRQRRSQPK